MLAALAGANLIYGLGMLESGVTFDYAQLVMDNEFAKMIKFTVKGIPVNDNTLNVEAIKEVGPWGDFLSHETTFQHMRSQSAPKLIDRSMREDWELSGSTDIYQRSLEVAKDILANHKPDPLPEGAAEKIRFIIEQTEKELGVK